MASKITALDANYEIYQLVKSIPKGKVATYGQIASIIQKLRRRQRSYGASATKIKNQNFSFKTKVTPRIIGWLLHQNKSADVPCHRAVDRDGKIAKNFAFGGAGEQRRRLMVEDVPFVDEKHVDLEKCLWQGKF